MTLATTRRVLSSAAVAAIVALALIVWALFSTRPVMLVLLMTIGQALGTLSLLLYGVVVVSDLWRARILSGEQDEEKNEQAARDAAGDVAQREEDEPS